MKHWILAKIETLDNRLCLQLWGCLLKCTKRKVTPPAAETLAEAPAQFEGAVPVQAHSTGQPGLESSECTTLGPNGLRCVGERGQRAQKMTARSLVQQCCPMGADASAPHPYALLTSLPVLSSKLAAAYATVPLATAFRSSATPPTHELPPLCPLRRSAWGRHCAAKTQPLQLCGAMHGQWCWRPSSRPTWGTGRSEVPARLEH